VDLTKGNWPLTYKAILNHIYYKGKMVAKSKTAYGIYFEINPDQVLILSEKNWKWAMVELFDRFNPNYKNPGYSHEYRPHWAAKLEKEGGQFIYNYNDRIWPALDHVVSILKKNKHERHAVLNIFDNSDIDPALGISRIPCTLSLHFFVNDNKVNLQVNMRTNDAVNLLIYDVFHHSMLQRYVASSLKLELGLYRHFSSIMYYQKKREERGYINKLLERFNDTPYLIGPTPEFHILMRHSINMVSAEDYESTQCSFFDDFININRSLIKDKLLRPCGLRFFRDVFKQGEI